MAKKKKDRLTQQIESKVDDINRHSQNLSKSDAKLFTSLDDLREKILGAVQKESTVDDLLALLGERYKYLLKVSALESKIRRADKYLGSIAQQYPIVVRGFDAKQAGLAQNWANRMIQWRHSHDFVGKRQGFVRTKYTGTTLPAVIDRESRLIGRQFGQLINFGNVMEGADSQIGLSGRYAQASDDWQYALGADTGVGDDFAYLREKEKEQSDRRSRRAAAREFARFRLDDYRIQDEDESAEYSRKRRKAKLDDERLRQSRMSISIHRRQAEAMRKYPWIKTLVEAGVIQKKELPKIAKTLSRYEKMPFIGKMIKHPVAAGLGSAAAIYALIASILASSDRANAATTSWWAAENIGGKPSGKFSGYAYLSGLGYKDQLKLWSGLSQKYGDPMLILRAAGQALESVKPGVERTNVANAFGLSAEAANTAMLLAKGSKTRKTITEAIRNNARYRMLEDDKVIKLMSGSGFWNTLEGIFREWIPGYTSYEARESLRDDINLLRRSRNGGSVRTSADEAHDAANSAIEYERSSPSVSNSTQTSMGGSMTISIGNLSVEANNAQELIASIEKEAGKRGNIDVIKWADSSRLKV